MSARYDEYIEQHRSNVYRAFQWLEKNTPGVFSSEEVRLAAEHQCKFAHDMSKYEMFEYEAYDAYFYGGNKSYEVVQNFNVAWLNHIHQNPHHWQHWILINDNPENGEIILDMPEHFIIEMVCDWWSFSWKQGKLDEIFNWYDQHKDHMKLSEYTRNKVEDVLAFIRKNLNESSEDV